MLVLSRKTGERILVGPDVKLTIVRIGPNSVRIGIDAPGHLAIVREELTLDGEAHSVETEHETFHPAKKG